MSLKANRADQQRRTVHAPSPGARQRLTQARGVSPSSPLVGANEAAKLLGVPPTWLLAQARARKVPHHKLGHYVRFDLDELITWLDQTKIDPGHNGFRR
jgi:excisionase family DNA binding protein